MTADELIAALQALPADQRTRQVIFDLERAFVRVDRVEQQGACVELIGLYAVDPDSGELIES